MGSRSTYTEAHDFYYFGVDEGREKQYSGVHLHYDGRTAISYSTAIARVIPRKGYKDSDVNTAHDDRGITLLSFDSMTATTAKHISALSSASPFTVMEVPFEFGCEWLEPDQLCTNFLKALAIYSSGVNHVAERTKFTRLMDARAWLLVSAAENWAKPLRDRRFREFEEIYENLDDWRRNLKKKLAEKAEKEEAAARRTVSRYTAKAKTSQGYLNLLSTLFGYSARAKRMNPDAKSTLRSAFTKSGESYCWVDGGEIVTSQHVHVPVKAARVLMKAWAAGKDMRTLKIENYSIVSYEGDTIQIGCHKIPRKNMLALYEVVIGNKFPSNEIGKAK